MIQEDIKFKFNTNRSTVHEMMKMKTGSKKDAVKLPIGTKKEEWFVVHVVKFFNSFRKIYFLLESDLWKENLDSFTISKIYEYRWKGKAHEDAMIVSPVEYMKKTLEYIKLNYENPKFVPQEDGQEFPPKFMEFCKNSFKKIFRVMTYLIVDKNDLCEELGLSDRIEELMVHFMTFVFAHRMIKRREIEPLNDWILENLGYKYKKYLHFSRKKKSGVTKYAEFFGVKKPKKKMKENNYIPGDKYEDPTALKSTEETNEIIQGYKEEMKQLKVKFLVLKESWQQEKRKLEIENEKQKQRADEAEKEVERLKTQIKSLSDT